MLERRTMRMSRLQLGLLLLAACKASSGGAITKEECQKVRTHSAELRLTGVNLNGSSPAEAAATKAAHIKNLASAGGEEYLEHCVATRDAHWLECALHAESLAEVERCNGSATSPSQP